MFLEECCVVIVCIIANEEIIHFKEHGIYVEKMQNKVFNKINNRGECYW